MRKSTHVVDTKSLIGKQPHFIALAGGTELIRGFLAAHVRGVTRLRPRH